MVFSKYIVSAVAGAGAAYAASCGSTSSSTTQNVQNQGDATAVGGCTTFNGDIHINANAGPSLNFGKLQKITGELSMDSDNQLTSLTLASLTDLGSLSLTNLTLLATLTMSSLTNVGGNMVLEDLAGLSSWDFGTSLKSAGNVSIQNVQINNLGQALTNVKQLDSVLISNCQFLQNIEFAVSTIESVDIGPNNVLQGQNVSFPQLTSATTLTIRNSTTVDIPMLSSVSDTFSLIGNTFKSFSAANLSSVGGLVVTDNPQINSLSFPSLTEINGTESALSIQNNTDLTNINGFPKLKDVKGAALFAGNINNISLTSLTNVDGAMVIDTTSTNFDCSPFQSLKNNQTIKGDLTCNTADPDASGSDNVSSSNTGSSGSGSGSGKSAASTLLPTFLTTGMFVTVLAFLL